MDVRERVGAWLTDAGCFFRVWAPHANAVKVLVQDEPFWKQGDDVAAEDLRNDGGYWSGTVAGVRPSQLYRFEIVTSDETFQTLDAAARDVFSSHLTRNDPGSANASVIAATERLAWAPFETPRFENFIIYELHVGSFAGFNDGIATTPATFQQIETKLGYIRDLGFNCIELMPVHEHARDRSWGYNPASFFAPESLYGSPDTFAHLIDTAHRFGLAVIIDVVYNHAGSEDNILYEFDGYANEGGIYFEGGQPTDWGRGPAWWKREVQEFFYQNGRMYLEQYRADGLRFDATTQINGDHLKTVVGRLREEFPDRYLVAEHLPDNPWIVTAGRFCATWTAEAHHQCQRALAGQDPLDKVKSFLGWNGYEHPWNLVKYTLGSHDDIGDLNNGDAEDGRSNWDRRHRYFVDQLGGRDDHAARAKCRVAWALNVAMPCTPMLFMGSECLMSAPYVGWGYWNDGRDDNGDHRFNWSAVDDPFGIEMRRLVAAANAVRWQNPALRADSLSITHDDRDNQVLAFVRESGDNGVLVVVNLSDRTFSDREYGVATGGRFGQWTQILCTQDAAFGGWDGAGNAFYDPWTQANACIYVNLPQWSVVVFRRSS
jgi:1,4-alpha-glucan branching enzyme